MNSPEIIVGPHLIKSLDKTIKLSYWQLENTRTGHQYFAWYNRRSKISYYDTKANWIKGMRTIKYPFLDRAENNCLLFNSARGPIDFELHLKLGFTTIGLEGIFTGNRFHNYLRANFSSTQAKWIRIGTAEKEMGVGDLLSIETESVAKIKLPRLDQFKGKNDRKSVRVKIDPFRLIFPEHIKPRFCSRQDSACPISACKSSDSLSKYLLLENIWRKLNFFDFRI